MIGLMKPAVRVSQILDDLDDNNKPNRGIILFRKMKLFLTTLKEIISIHNFRLVGFSIAMLIGLTNGFRIQAVSIIRPSLDSQSANKLVGKH